MYSLVLMAALTTGTENVSFGHRACHGYTSSYYTCYGSCYGHRCYGGYNWYRGCCGSAVCYGYHTFYGGVVLSQTSPLTSATMVVSLPAKATLKINDDPTNSTSGTRTLISPPLENGSTYVYTLRAELNGQVQSQDVRVRPGETTNVQFTFPSEAIAGR